MSRFAIFALAAATLATSVYAAPSTEEMNATAAAQVRGEAMYQYDQAAWHASDSFQSDLAAAHLKTAQLAKEGLQGYVVEPLADQRFQTTFYARKEGGYSAFARYVTDQGKVVSGGLLGAGQDTSVSAVAQHMIEARAKAIEEMAKPGHFLCSKSAPNTIVLPPSSDGSISVYVLTSTMDSSTYPAGGHNRFDFGPDGKLASERGFMKSCFPISLKGKDGVKPEIMVLTHLLDPQPTEVHAFVSRNLPFPLMIATIQNKEMWLVSAGKIEFVRDISSK